MFIKAKIFISKRWCDICGFGPTLLLKVNVLVPSALCFDAFSNVYSHFPGKNTGRASGLRVNECQLTHWCIICCLDECDIRTEDRGGVPLHRCRDGVAGRPSCMAGTAFYPQSSWHCSCHPQEGKVERSMTPRRGFWQHPLPSWPGERAEMGRPATESIDRGPGLH